MKEINVTQSEQLNTEAKIVAADFETKTIKKPQDFAKIDYSEYFKELRKEIPAKVAFGTPHSRTIPSNVKVPDVKQKLFTEGNNTYLYAISYKNEKHVITVSKVMNAVLEKIKPYRLIYNNKTVKPPEASIQLVFRMDNGELSENVILDNKAKSQLRELSLAIQKSNNRIQANFSELSFLLFMEAINKQVQNTVLCRINHGRVNHGDLKGRQYSNAYAENGVITPANEDGEVYLEKTALTLDKSKLAMLPKLYLGDYDVKAELHKDLSQMERIYKGKIEPFLGLGAAVLSVYLDEIWENLPGFPVVYLQGNTKQGKSLLQGVISNIFGYSNKQMAMGNSTDNAIAMKCHRANCTPICINDYDFFQAQSAKFENNIVHLYESGIREKMYDGVTTNLMPISSTAIYSSNYLPCVKPKIFNRLLPAYFPDNGLDTGQITNEFVNDIRRSRILVELQKFSAEYVLNYIERIEKFILSFDIFNGKDRESNNVAIAFTGLMLLEHIAGYELPNRDELLKEYCIWYDDMIKKTTSPVDNFLNALPSLFHKSFLKKDKNFKIELKEGRIIFTFDTQECANMYNSYCSQENCHSMVLNTKTFAHDLKASNYYIGRTTIAYQNKTQASSTILDITDSANGKCFYYSATGILHNVEFAEKPTDPK